MDLTLCYAPMACSLVAYVNLTEAGAPFKVRTVNTGAKEQKSAEDRRHVKQLPRLLSGLTKFQSEGVDGERRRRLRPRCLGRGAARKSDSTSRRKSGRCPSWCKSRSRQVG